MFLFQIILEYNFTFQWCAREPEFKQFLAQSVSDRCFGNGSCGVE